MNTIATLSIAVGRCEKVWLKFRHNGRDRYIVGVPLSIDREHGKLAFRTADGPVGIELAAIKKCVVLGDNPKVMPLVARRAGLPGNVATLVVRSPLVS